MLLSEINQRTRIGDASWHTSDGEYVKTDDKPYVLLYVNYAWGRVGGSYDHPNMLGRRHHVIEQKFDSRSRGKFWTAQLGAQLFLAIPKDKIEVIPRNYESINYDPIKFRINGVEVYPSLGGGTGGKQEDGDYGWTHWIGGIVGLYNQPNKKILNAIHDVALTVDEAKAHGIELDFSLEDHYQESLDRELARYSIMPKLDEGWRIMLSDFSINGSKGPFIVNRPKRHKDKSVQVGSNRTYAKVTYNMINWIKTAELNAAHFDMIEYSEINRCPKVEVAVAA